MTMHNCFLLVILSHIRTLWCNLLYLVLMAAWLNELKHSIRVGIHVSNLRVSFVTTTAALNLKKIAVFPTWHAVFSPTSDVTPSTWRWLVWPPSLNPGGKQKRLTWRADARENVRPRRSWLACSSPVVTHGRTCFKCLLINIHVSSSIQWPPSPPPPPLPSCSPTSCCLVCPKLFLNLHNLDWSAFQMAFPVLTLSGNKGRDTLNNQALMVCGITCVCMWERVRDWNR